MSFLQNRLALLKSALVYLDLHNQIERIKQDAANFKQSEACFIYNFSVDVDLGYITEYDAELGAHILSVPLESANLFQEVIFQFCLSHNLLPADTTYSQICARLRIIHFPSDFHSLQIASVSDLTKYVDYQGFVRLVGVATGVSGPAKYTQSTKYICPNEDCPRHEGNYYIRIHVPGASETQTIRNDFMCMLCGENLEEVKSLRILSGELRFLDIDIPQDKIAVEIMPIQLQGLAQREAIKLGCGQAITVFVRDELVNTIELGKAYEVIGICRTDVLGDDITVTLEVLRVLPQYLAPLPKVFQDMYDCYRKSPWSFPFSVAYKFGDMIASGGVMIKFRLLLLMSLVLSPQKNPLHILGIGKETRLSQSLMEYAQQFSLRSFPASVTTPLTGKVIYDKHAWAPYFIQCGSLLLSSGGVCPVGDFGGWKKTNRDHLQAVLTGSKIFLDLASKHLGGISQQLTFPMECHVWGVYDPTGTGVKTLSQRDAVFGGCDTGDLTKGFLDAFSYICFLECDGSTTEHEIMTQVIDHTISSWCVDEYKASTFSREEFENFLAMSREVEVKMRPKAESLIQNYYTAIRMARSSGLNGSDVPPTAILTLTSLSIGFAKLKLQPYVAECDALMAVFLYEESLAARYGVSVLRIQPQPHVANSRILEFLNKKNDMAMQQFYDQLCRFCSCVVDSCSLYREE